MGVGAERPRTRGGTSQKLGRNDRVWGGRVADRPGGNRLWGVSTGTRLDTRAFGARLVPPRAKLVPSLLLITVGVVGGDFSQSRGVWYVVQ